MRILDLPVAHKVHINHRRMNASLDFEDVEPLLDPLLESLLEILLDESLL